MHVNNMTIDKMTPQLKILLVEMSIDEISVDKIT
jgi:hypothetical protein